MFYIQNSYHSQKKFLPHEIFFFPDFTGNKHFFKDGLIIDIYCVTYRQSFIQIQGRNIVSGKVAQQHTEIAIGAQRRQQHIAVKNGQR